MQKFSGEGTPLPQSDPIPLGAIRYLDLRAYGAQAQRDTPRKNPSYGLEFVITFWKEIRRNSRCSCKFNKNRYEKLAFLDQYLALSRKRYNIWP